MSTSSGMTLLHIGKIIRGVGSSANEGGLIGLTGHPVEFPSSSHILPIYMGTKLDLSVIFPNRLAIPGSPSKTPGDFG